MFTYIPKTLFLLAFACLVSGCANYYLTEDGASRVKTHRVVAVVPATITFVPSIIPMPESHRLDSQLTKDLQKTWSILFQKELYNRLIIKKQHRQLNVDILDIDSTLIRLKKAGYFDDPYMPTNQVCEVLGVDGIITSTYTLSEPYSNSESILLDLVLGPVVDDPFIGPYPGNKVTLLLEIYDRESPRPIWGYAYKMGSTPMISHGELVYTLVKMACKKMPYRK
jgi:hypothetical protein